MSASTIPFESSTKRSSSRTRRPTSRPTTPLRPSSRSSLRESGRSSAAGGSDAPLEALEPAFAELSDSMADLEANFMYLQLMHESLSRFSESFASFLYGLNMNAFCVDFPEAPIPDSFRRATQQEEHTSNKIALHKVETELTGLGRSTNSEKFHGTDFDGETTFMTTDTSFVENPPTSSKATPKKLSTPAPASRMVGGPGRGGTAPSGRGGAARGGIRGTRGSGLARAKRLSPR